MMQAERGIRAAWSSSIELAAGSCTPEGDSLNPYSQSKPLGKKELVKRSREGKLLA